MDIRKHEIYEKCVAMFCAERDDHNFVSVTANAKIQGIISKRSRQIDVLIEDLRYSPNSYRVIVDAKLRKRPLSIEEIEAFEGKMKDVGASHGVLIISSGVTSSAKRRGEDAITIEILEYEDAVEEYDWKLEPCLTCSKSKNFYGTVLWSPHKVVECDLGWLMYRIGKCSSCGSFHTWCGDCGSDFPIPDGKIINCSCNERAWGAIPESKTSGHEGKPNSTWLMLRHNGKFFSLERKPIGNVKR